MVSLHITQQKPKEMKIMEVLIANAPVLLFTILAMVAYDSLKLFWIRRK